MNKNIKWYLLRVLKMKPKEVIFRGYELLLVYILSVYFRYRKLRLKNNELNINHSERLLYLDNYKNELNKLISETHQKENTYNNSFFKALLFNGDDFRLLWNSYRFDDLLLASIKKDLFYDKFKAFSENNKYLYGINYISTMECAIRCINLYSALLIQKNNGIKLRDDEISAYYQFFKDNLLIISTRISRFSSRGNHTIFEYAGCFICALAINNERLKIKYLSLLKEEFDFQINNDGSGIEQSIDYHAFNIDLLIFLELLTEKRIISDKKRSNVNNFLSAFLNKNDFIRFGDSDSSFLFTRFENINLLKGHDCQSKQVNFDDCGFFVNKNDKFKVIVKYGNLGMKPLFGHGHFDFLSVSISFCDQQLTKDSMTYLYSSDIRKKIRGPLYHSMPYINEDIKQLSSFSWETDKSGQLLSFSYNNNYMYSSYVYKHKDGDIIRSIYIYSEYIIIIDEFDSINININIKVNWFIDDKFSELLSIYDNNFKKIKLTRKIMPFSKSYGDLSMKASRLEAEGEKRVISIWNFSNTSSIELTEIIKDILK